MADANSNTGLSAPIPVLDELASLAGAYESFLLLTFVEDGPTSPVPPVLAELNKRLRSIVNDLDSQRFLS